MKRGRLDGIESGGFGGGSGGTSGGGSGTASDSSERPRLKPTATCKPSMQGSNMEGENVCVTGRQVGSQ